METSSTLNVLGGVFAAAGTLCAFGGKTWRETDEALIKRVTVRGWLSIALLLLGLAVAITKEFDADTSSKKSVKEKEALTTQLAVANESLGLVSEQLRASKELLTVVREELGQAQKYAERQSTNTLMLSLLNGAPVKNIALVLPADESLRPVPRMLAVAGSDPSPLSVLLSRVPAQLREHLLVDIGFLPNTYSANIRLTVEATGTRLIPLAAPRGARGTLVRGGCIDLSRLAASVANFDCTKPAFLIDTTADAERMNAARVLSWLSAGSIAVLKLRLGRDGFANEVVAREYIRTATHLPGGHISVGSKRGSYSVRFEFPPGAIDSIRIGLDEIIRSSRVVASLGNGVVRFVAPTRLGGNLLDSGYPMFSIEASSPPEVEMPRLAGAR